MLSVDIKKIFHTEIKFFTKNNSEEFFSFLSSFAGTKRKIFIISDDIVANLHLSRIINSLESKTSVETIVFKHGENSKSFKTAFYIINKIVSSGIEKQDVVLALGGGTVSDLAGFCASVLLRGVEFIILPTTLLAASDAALGGKTAVNLGYGKNLVGSFAFPSYVLINPTFFETLPHDELINGISEMAKVFVLEDLNFFESFISLIHKDEMLKPPEADKFLKRAVQIKTNIVNLDPFEKNLRYALNFGHTVGHAVELASGYSLSHGKAVAAGMIAELKICKEICGFGKEYALKLQNFFEKLGVQTEITFKTNILISYMLADKKNLNGKIGFSMPVASGKISDLGTSYFPVHIEAETVRNILNGLKGKKT